MTREPFDWLPLSRYHLRGHLRQIRSAIRGAQLDGPEHAERRAALMKALEALQSEPDLPRRAVLGVARILIEMMTRDSEKP